MMELSQIKNALEDRNLSVVARACDLSPATLCRVKSGKAENANPSTLRLLSDYLTDNAKKILEGGK